MKIESRTAYFVMSDTMGEVGPFWNKGMAESLLLSLTLQENRSKALMKPKSVQPAKPLEIVEDISSFQSVMSRMGFNIWHTGGGCTAWQYEVPNADSNDHDGSLPYIMVTNDDQGHIMINTDEFPDNWNVGFYWHDRTGDECYTEELLNFPSNEELLKALPFQKDMFAIAWRFFRLLEAYHADEQLQVIQHLNALEKNDMLCHSHTFCDANEMMIEAFETVKKRKVYWASDADDIEGETAKADHVANADLDGTVMQAAWAFAKKHFLSRKYLPSEQTETFRAVLAEVTAKNLLR